MTTKTPKFDTVLDKILKVLQPHDRVCKECGATFSIFKEDIAMYKMLIVPPPTRCPNCRAQRRLGYRINFLPIFYKRNCDAPGHIEKIITFYHPENPTIVYDDAYYLGDAWDPLALGRDYDANVSFFETFNQLARTVPHQSLSKDPKSMDCEYVVSGVDSKDCYYVAIPMRSESVYYSYLPLDAKQCVDVARARKCEYCYECVTVEEMYNCDFCYQSMNCLDSAFLFDCKNCSHCFGGTNLRNKKYVFWNEQLTKEAYEAKVAKINLGKHSELDLWRKRFEELAAEAIHRCTDNLKIENAYGDSLRGAKNCYQCFLIYEGENMRYAFSLESGKDAMDIFGSSYGSLMYDSTGIVYGSNVRFSLFIRTGLEIEYSAECSNCEYCFGCFGLKNKKYCIFNKQYTEEVYWARVDELKTAMLARGEYGEFFPLQHSWYAYNDSNAAIEFPLSKEEVQKRGWYWQEPLVSDINIAGMNVLKPEEIPDDIADVGSDILDKVIICEKTGKPFRITSFELSFYRQKHLPLPTIHPFERIKDRFIKINRYKMYDVVCGKCGKKTYTSYDTARKLRIYCEACYQAEII